MVRYVRSYPVDQLCLSFFFSNSQVRKKFARTAGTAVDAPELSSIPTKASSSCAFNAIFKLSGSCLDIVNSVDVLDAKNSIPLKAHHLSESRAASLPESAKMSKRDIPCDGALVDSPVGKSSISVFSSSRKPSVSLPLPLGQAQSYQPSDGRDFNRADMSLNKESMGSGVAGLNSILPIID